MLKLYRWPTDDWRKLGADLPPEIIWIDLLSPSDEEKAFVERRLNIRVPSEDSLGEIEASSRLIFDHDTLYLSSPSVRIDEDKEAQLTSIGFIIGPRVLVTVHFWPLPTFDKVAKEMETDGDLQNGMCVFTSLVEAMVDRGADVLEQLGTNADHLSRSVFKGGLVRSKRPMRSSRRMREALASVGDLADRLAKARDVCSTSAASPRSPARSAATGSRRPRNGGSRRCRKTSPRSATTSCGCRTRSSCCSMPSSASSASSRTICSRS